MTEPTSDPDLRNDFLGEMNLQGGPHEADMETEYPVEQVLDAAETGDLDLDPYSPDDVLTSDEANAILGGGAVEETDHADVITELPEEGSREEAVRMLTLASGGEDPYAQAEVPEEGPIDPETSRMRSELAAIQATLAERQRVEDDKAADSDDWGVEGVDWEYEDGQEEVIDYASPEIVAQVGRTYGIDKETATQVAKGFALTAQHYDESVVQPRMERLREEFVAQGAVDEEVERETLVNGNIADAKVHIKEHGNETERAVYEQFEAHKENSLLYQHFAQGNEFQLMSGQGVVDAVELLAGRIQAAHANPNAKPAIERPVVGEETHATIGRAVRRGPSASQPAEQTPEEAIRSSIVNVAPRVPSFLRG